MGMRIDTLYNFVVYIIRKERNGFVSIDDFNQVIPRAQVDCYNDFYKSIPKGQKEHDALAPFKTSFTFTTGTSPNGVVTLPDTYAHLISGNTTVSGVDFPITFPEEDELPYARNPYGLRAPSLVYPIGEEISMGVFQLTPATPQAGKMWYYREPTTPIYAFTLNGRTITYDAVNSVDVEFTDLYQNQIVAECLKYFGINLSDQEVFQFGLLKDKETE